jgi:hypothetical protein
MTPKRYVRPQIFAELGDKLLRVNPEILSSMLMYIQKEDPNMINSLKQLPILAYEKKNIKWPENFLVSCVEDIPVLPVHKNKNGKHRFRQATLVKLVEFVFQHASLLAFVTIHGDLQFDVSFQNVCDYIKNEDVNATSASKNNKRNRPRLQLPDNLLCKQENDILLKGLIGSVTYSSVLSSVLIPPRTILPPTIYVVDSGKPISQSNPLEISDLNLTRHIMGFIEVACPVCRFLGSFDEVESEHDCNIRHRLSYTDFLIVCNVPFRRNRIDEAAFIRNELAVHRDQRSQYYTIVYKDVNAHPGSVLSRRTISNINVFIPTPHKNVQNVRNRFIPETIMKNLNQLFDGRTLKFLSEKSALIKKFQLRFKVRGCYDINGNELDYKRTIGFYNLQYHSRFYLIPLHEPYIDRERVVAQMRESFAQTRERFQR